MRPSVQVASEAVASDAGLDRVCRLEATVAGELKAAADDIDALRRDITGLNAPYVRATVPEEAPTVDAVPEAARAGPGGSRVWPWPVLGAVAVLAVAGAVLGGTAAFSGRTNVPLAGDGVRAFARAASVAAVAPPATAAPMAQAPAAVAAQSDLGQAVYGARFGSVSAAERTCLARAIYFEARGESFEGQVAVAQVVLNRARSVKWPNSLCRVVYQGVERRQKCQFSFACLPHAEPSGDLWEVAQQVADQAVSGHAWLREAMDVTYYHTLSVAPVWRLKLTPVATIGSHVFYRDPGGLRTAPGVKPAPAVAHVPRVQQPAVPQAATAAIAAVPRVPSEIRVEQSRVKEARSVGSVAPQPAAQPRKRPAAANDANWSANLLQPKF